MSIWHSSALDKALTIHPQGLRGRTSPMPPAHTQPGVPGPRQPGRARAPAARPVQLRGPAVCFLCFGHLRAASAGARWLLMLPGQLTLEPGRCGCPCGCRRPQVSPSDGHLGWCPQLHRASAAATGGGPCHRALGAAGMGQGRGAWAAPAPALHTASPTGNTYTGCSLKGVVDSLRFLLKIQLYLEAIRNS